MLYDLIGNFIARRGDYDRTVGVMMHFNRMMWVPGNWTASTRCDVIVVLSTAQIRQGVLRT